MGNRLPDLVLRSRAAASKDVPVCAERAECPGASFETRLRRFLRMRGWDAPSALLKMSGWMRQNASCAQRQDRALRVQTDMRRQFEKGKVSEAESCNQQPQETPMQVFGLPSHCIRNGRAASRLLERRPRISKREKTRRRSAMAASHGRWARQRSRARASVRRAPIFIAGEAPRAAQPQAGAPAQARPPTRLVERSRPRLDFPMWAAPSSTPVRSTRRHRRAHHRPTRRPRAFNPSYAAPASLRPALDRQTPFAQRLPRT